LQSTQHSNFCANPQNTFKALIISDFLLVSPAATALQNGACTKIENRRVALHQFCAKCCAQTNGTDFVALKGGDL
jgi:hypothetical protein